MTEIDAGGQSIDVASRALSCAACHRLGGALYVFSYYGKCENLYLQVDAGISAGIVSTVRGTLNTKAVELAARACRKLPEVYDGPSDIGNFVRAGMGLFGAVLEDMWGQDPSGLSYEDVFEEAVAVAGLWPGTCSMGDFATPADFERSCQCPSVEQVHGRDFLRLRKLAGTAALQFRNLAMAELDARRS